MIPQHVPSPQKEAEDDRYHIKENDKTILIIEDDEVFARVLLNIAREKGYKGIMAHQGNTGPQPGALLPARCHYTRYEAAGARWLGGFAVIEE